MAKTKELEHFTYLGFTFRIVNKSRTERKYLEGIIPKTTRAGKPLVRYIEVADWNEWKTSKWIHLVDGDQQIILDSGVIMELADFLSNMK